MDLRPSGLVTFLFTDIVGSTHLWEHYPTAMPAAFDLHEQVLRQACNAHSGFIYKMIGDAFQVAFVTATQAVLAAVAAQRGLRSAAWGATGPISVRMALHSGHTEERSDDYIGPLLNRLARMLATGAGGQILLSQATMVLIQRNMPNGISLQDLGIHQLKNLIHPEHIFQVVVPDLPAAFPPLKSLPVIPATGPAGGVARMRMEQALVWNDAHVKLLLEAPQQLIASEPWQSWVSARGGIQAVRQHLTALPLPDPERRLLEQIVAHPGARASELTTTLDIQSETYQRVRTTLSQLLTSNAIPERAAGVSVAANPRATHTHNASFPAPLTTLIGRSEEVATVCTWLQNPGMRLITLVGPGGIGKTRLAIQIAWESVGDFADGMVFVALTPISDPAMVVPTIVRALGITDDGTQDLTAQLHRYCAPRHLCLIIDNAEHLLEAAPSLSALLRHAPHLRMIVTSRVRLDLYGEQLFSVPALSLPAQATGLPFEQQRNFDAVRLFADRAQAVDPTFALVPATIELVHAICVRLEGLPLAIELAAGHLYHHKLPSILVRLEERLAFLTNGPRDADPRQRTLYATIAWSEALLAPAVQQVFRQLSVLADGWTLAALTAIAADDRDDSEAILRTLIDHHLVYPLHSTLDEPHFGMLETIREYALHQLRSSGAEDDLRTRHAMYYVEFAEPSERYLSGAHQIRWNAHLDAAYPNIRAALAWTLAANLVETGVQLAGALGCYWAPTAQYAEGRGWLERVLAQEGVAATNARFYARALQGLARTYISTSQEIQAIPLIEQALAISQHTDDVRLTASILSDLGVFSVGRGAYAQAAAYHEQSLALRRELGDPGEIGMALAKLGTLIYKQCNYRESAHCYQEALDLFRSVGNTNGIAMMLNNLGAVAKALGEYTEAEQILTEALAVRYEIGHVGGIIMTTNNLAQVAAQLGHTAQARRYLAEALRRSPDTEELFLFWMIEIFVRICMAEGAIETAMQWCGTAQQIRLTNQLIMDADDEEWYATTLAQAEAQLGSARVQAAIARGHTLTADQAFTLLLQSVQGDAAL